MFKLLNDCMLLYHVIATKRFMASSFFLLLHKQPSLAVKLAQLPHLSL